MKDCCYMQVQAKGAVGGTALEMYQDPYSSLLSFGWQVSCPFFEKYLVLRLRHRRCCSGLDSLRTGKFNSRKRE
jgi:hypothetical protein